jgi:uncharacterized protein YbjT (DUF2867 family)
MMGATGAVGTETLHTLLKDDQFSKLTLLGRRIIPEIDPEKVFQFEIDIFKPETYSEILTGHDTAICTLGVGEPSKMDRAEFIKIDKIAVLDFAKACKSAGVKHFELLASVGINAKSSSYYLKAKGELVDELKALKFDRLSVFQPSMIITPKNRYGWSQAIVLKVWPWISPLFIGSANKYRGISVAILGSAIAKNVFTKGKTEENLFWADFHALDKKKSYF